MKLMKLINSNSWNISGFTIPKSWNISWISGTEFMNFQESQLCLVNPLLYNSLCDKTKNSLWKIVFSERTNWLLVWSFEELEVVGSIQRSKCSRLRAWSQIILRDTKRVGSVSISNITRLCYSERHLWLQVCKQSKDN